jgi:hypothetical protein
MSTIDQATYFLSVLPFTPGFSASCLYLSTHDAPQPTTLRCKEGSVKCKENTDNTVSKNVAEQQSNRIEWVLLLHAQPLLGDTLKFKYKT